MSKTKQTKKTDERTLAQARGERFARELPFSSVVDEEKRTVELAFSSEHPVERWFGFEEIDHTKMDMSRFERGGVPLLVNHNPDDLVGVVEVARVDDDKRGRAVVRFGNSKRAKEIFADVKDGIRQLVSFSYEVTDAIKTGVRNGLDVVKVATRPFELSLVSVPADASVGVGRADPKAAKVGANNSDHLLEKRQMTEKTENPPKVETRDAPKVDLTKEREAARSAERKRIADIHLIGEKFGMADAARSFIDEGKTVDQFREAALEHVSKRDKNLRVATESNEIGMTSRERKEYSFVRALNALVNPNDPAAQQAAAFERECSNAAAKQYGKEARGIMVPDDVVLGGSRDLNVTTAADGGNLVATDLLAGDMIELLRDAMVISGLGARFMPGMVGNAAIPKQSGGATAYWLNPEGTAPTESQQAIAQVALNIKDVGAFTEYTRRLLLQSSIGVEQFVRNDLAQTIASALDLAAIYGSGAGGQPTGIINTAGIGSVTFAAPDPTWGEVVDLESAVAQANAQQGGGAYVSDATMRGAMKQTEKATGTAQFIAEGNSVNGYPLAVTNAMTDGDLLFGHFSNLIVALWSGIDLTVDPFSNSTTGTVRVVAFQSADIAVRHAESFALGNDGV